MSLPFEDPWGALPWSEPAARPITPLALPPPLALPVPVDDPLRADSWGATDEPEPAAEPEIAAEVPPEPTPSNTELAAKRAAIRRLFNPLLPPEVVVKEIPEKEGLVFRHINYMLVSSIEVDGDTSTKRVARRYSDFVWLLEVLVARYPFRVIPDLPPKKFSGMCQRVRLPRVVLTTQ